MDVEIDWASADVKDATLTVPLTGHPSPAWVERLRQVIARLEHSDDAGRRVKVTRKRLRVKDLSPGGEDDLRFLLEGAVLQVNADFAPDDEGENARSDADEAMISAFRAFAEDRAPERGATG